MIKLIKRPNYRLGIEGPKEEIDDLKKNLLYTMHTTSRRDWFTKKLVYEEVREDLFDEVTDESIEIFRGLTEYVLYYALNNGMKVDANRNVVEVVDPPQLNDRWRKVFESHPRGPEYSAIQLEAFERVLSRPGASAEIGTGIGKTEILLSFVDHLRERGNVLILAPDNTVRSEIQSRGEKYDVDIRVYDWSHDILVLSPTGFLRAKESKKPEVLEWMKKVKTIITDESHHLSANSWRKIFDMCDNVEFSYGFSATTDKDEGRDLRVQKTSLQEMGLFNSQVISMSGLIKIRKKIIVDTVINVLSTTIASKKVPFTEENESGQRVDRSWISVLDDSIRTDRMSEILARIVKMSEGEKVYIPIYKSETGIDICQRLTKRGVRTAFWCSGILMLGEEVLDDDSLDKVKELANNDMFDVLITTSKAYEGADIPGLGVCVPLTGKSHRMVVQPAGRAARRSVLQIWVIYDSNNPMILSQSKSRHERIKSEYRIIKTNNHRNW